MLQVEHFAGLVHNLPLVSSQCEEFKAVAQPIAIAHQRAYFHGIGSFGKSQFERDDLARLQLAGEGRANSVPTHLIGTAPYGVGLAIAEKLEGEADIQRISRKTAARAGGICRFNQGSVSFPGAFVVLPGSRMGFIFILP